MVAVTNLPLGSIDAVRPVFLIVMGIFLMVIAWRVSRVSDVWTGRMIVAGSLLLGFGYAFLLPLYQAGVIESYSPRGHYQSGPASAVGWHAVKILAMNGGWLLFGIGLAMHAKLFNAPAPRPALNPLTRTSHESVA
ncbi:MAG: hypothetical protein WEB53_14140 [Akkermansiaceae bacterium]|jgi:hypothetical protein